MATREVMIRCIVEDTDRAFLGGDSNQRRALQGFTTTNLTACYEALDNVVKVTVDEPKAPKKTLADGIVGRESLLRKGEKLGLDRDGMAGLNNVELLAFITDEPKAEKGTMNGYVVKGVAVTPIMEEWTKSVSDEVTMQDMLENIRLAFLEGRHHFGNELIQAAKEAC